MGAKPGAASDRVKSWCLGLALLSAWVPVFVPALVLAQANGQSAAIDPPTGSEVRLVRVVTSGGFAAAYDLLAPRFEALTGVVLETEYGSSSGGASDSIPARLARGEGFDVVILSRPSLERLVESAQLVAESRTDLVRSRIGMAVKADAMVPDISTVDAFTAVLLGAQSIGYSASASGTYLSTELWPKMGLWPQLRDRSRRIVSERVASVVARGEVEIGFQQISEILPIAGVQFAGPIPDSLQRVTVFSAALTRRADNPDDARALLDFLSSAEAVPVIESLGLDAVVGNTDSQAGAR